MNSPATLRTRLANTDRAALAGPGPAANALRRSLLAGSRVAVIDPGYISKRFLYKRAAALGVELVLVGDPSSWARSLVREGSAALFVDADPSGDPDEATARVLDALGDEAGNLDGVVTFWEDAVPATARIGAALGLPGAPPRAADGARSKLLTLEASRAAGLPIPRFMLLDGAAGLAAAAEHVGFPAVIKPVFGAEAMGCLRIDDLEGLQAGYERVSGLISPAMNPIFTQGCDLFLEEYLDGIEFDVDIVLSGGECVFTAMSENWPTDEPYFVETGMHSPSAHPADRLEAITDLCVRTALALGFTDSVLHAEAKDTSRGPRLLEMNARLGGGFIAEIHSQVTGIDLVEQQLLVAVGLPASPTPYSLPACGVVTVFLHAAQSGTLRHTRFLDHLVDEPAVVARHVNVTPGEQVTAAADGFPTVIAELTVRGDTVAAARAKGEEIVTGIGIPYVR